MQQNKKQPYLAPAVKVVSYKVEIGQAGSSSNVNPINNNSQQVNIGNFEESTSDLDWR